MSTLPTWSHNSMVLRWTNSYSWQQKRMYIEIQPSCEGQIDACKPWTALTGLLCEKFSVIHCRFSRRTWHFRPSSSVWACVWCCVYLCLLPTGSLRLRSFLTSGWMSQGSVNSVGVCVCGRGGRKFFTIQCYLTRNVAGGEGDEWCGLPGQEIERRSE